MNPARIFSYGLSLVFVLFAGMSLAAGTLTLAYVPQENPDKLLGDIEVISEYLAGELGMEVRGFVTQDHAAAIEALGSGAADVSFMGGLPYVIAHEHVGAEVLLGEVYRGEPTYSSRIFVRKDRGFDSLADLAGRTIAFADPISESGYLFPLDAFVKAGLFEAGQDPREFFGRVYFAGGYQQALQAVVEGFVDAAGVSRYSDLLLDPEDLAEVEWIGESDLIPSHAVVTRAGLDPDVRAAVRDALLKLNEEEYQYLLEHVFGPDGFVVVEDSDYDSVRELARLHGVID